MPGNGEYDDHFSFLKDAFSRDGFTVYNFYADEKYKNLPYVRPLGYLEFQGQIGIMATQDSQNPFIQHQKRAFYLEGNNYQIGYLLGLMAEPDVSRMTTDFVENIIFDFFKKDELEKLSNTSLFDLIKKIIIDLIAEGSKPMRSDVPPEYVEELHGLYEGCLRINPQTKVKTDPLWALNFGIDFLLAHIYTGKIFAEKKIPPFLLKVPLMCNAFSISGSFVKDNGHFFGRDFMFPTANVYQDTACLIIYNPKNGPGRPYHPIVSQTAPGIIGSMAAMNSQGVAIGVDMLPSKFCAPDRPGLNSLCLNRYCLENSATLDEAIATVTSAQRGVSWLYPVADGKSGQSCIIEAGSNISDKPFPYTSYLEDYYKPYLPDENYIAQKRSKYGTPAPQSGLMPRLGNYPYPDDFINDFNKNLWDRYNHDLLPHLKDLIKDLVADLIQIFKHTDLVELLKTIVKEILELLQKAKYDPHAFGERGYINKTYKDKNCPGPFYFAPQREKLENVALVSNHCITPEMRMTAMSEWIALVTAGNVNDIQWRYDELNNEILTAVDEAKKPQNPALIDAKIAWKLINFLTPGPEGYFPDYYNHDSQVPWQTVQVHGSVSLFDLKKKTISSLFGYYGDTPATITLPNYLKAG